MPRYRFILPSRALGGYRLPEAGLTADCITLTPGDGTACTAKVKAVLAENAVLAYEMAKERVDGFFGYLAILGNDAAFVLDGLTGAAAQNEELKEKPIPTDLPPPPFESIGGIVPKEAEEIVGSWQDPDGSKRRSGVVLVHDAKCTVVPGQERAAQLCKLFCRRESVPPRVRLALAIMHDAACAREIANGFTQSLTALEVLTEHLRPLSLLDSFYRSATEGPNSDTLPYQSKAKLLSGLRQFLIDASLPADQADRIASYASTAQLVSQVDIFRDYLAGLNITVDRCDVLNWRKLRGALVHSASAGDDHIAAMERCRDVVRAALLEELQRASGPLDVVAGQNATL